MQPEESPRPEQRGERDEPCDKLEKLVIQKQRAEERVRRLKKCLKDLEEPDRRI